MEEEVEEELFGLGPTQKSDRNTSLKNLVALDSHIFQKNRDQGEGN